MIRRILPFVALAALLMPPAGAHANAYAGVRHCYGVHVIGGDEPNIWDVSARNLSCDGVRFFLSRGHITRTGNVYIPSATGRGVAFHCYVLQSSQVNGTVLGAEDRCISTTQAFRFRWST